MLSYQNDPQGYRSDRLSLNLLKNVPVKDMKFLEKPTEVGSWNSSKDTPLSALYQLNLWEIAIAAVGELREWQSGLIAVSFASILLSSNPPLLGLAVVASNTLNPHRAVETVITIWLTDWFSTSAIGQIPLNINSLNLAICNGVQLLLVTGFVIRQPKFSRSNFSGYLGWLGLSAIAAYILTQGNLMLFDQWTDSFGAIDPNWLASNLLWVFGLSVIHCAIVWLLVQTIPQYSRPVFPPRGQFGDRPWGCGRKF
ncbi:MAG: hypothetical protein J7545_17920 [Roseofilum sp. SBFL]|uniref:hypothetical protein n=1 Tax=unclassified Roseofilum TaxID=2620099 RepID=UPI001B05745A|nr:MULTISPECIES: hypothetical protein [unclassified Roseofilum]MBP0015858.1 hypothetical protein [Roseofilum sp. SID3]MBP0025418.1 hypothetical protein [Roseofilum sp. SID2]MBP0038666.1 hypothetical protein [Roseofilum sp. SID1]MBP0043826.1 hypothetical protein [Roseofilum sp. SBFL]